MPRPSKLNPKQAAFVKAYIANGGNGTRAAIEAGYSPKTAHAQACWLLKHPEVQRQLTGIQRRALDAAQVTEESITLELARLACSNVAELYGPDGKLLPIHQLPLDVQRAIQSLEFEGGELKRVRFHPKGQALELLLKKMGLLVEKQDVKVEGAVTLEVLLKSAKLVAERKRAGS